MKVICIKGSFFLPITKNKIYTVIGCEDLINNIYWIVNDKGYEDFYPIYHFKELSEIRDEQINKLLC